MSTSGTFLDLKEWACRTARFDATDTTDLALAGQAVNDAYMSICSTGDPWRFLLQEGQWTTTAGDDVYTFDTIATAMGVSTSHRIDEILALTDDVNGDWINASSWNATERSTLSTQDDPTGRPFVFTQWGNDRVRLYPTPDETYTLGCLVRLTPQEMSSATDAPLIPFAWRRRLIVPFAAATLLRTEGGLETASEAERLLGRFDDDMTRFRTAYGTNNKTFNLESPGFREKNPIAGEDWFR